MGKTWDPTLLQYRDDEEETLQADKEDEEKDVLKLKAKGAPARQLANMLLRKTKKKGSPNGPA